MAATQKIIRLFCTGFGSLEKQQVELASSVLNNSGVIALPTDTLYGIAAKASDTSALERIYKIKGRDATKPLAVCVANVDLITEVAEVGGRDMSVIKSLLPGPITFVLKRSEKLNKSLNPNLETIGVRVVDHVFMRTVCRRTGPLALTSANRSGEMSPVDVSDFQDIWDDLDFVFDAGELRKTLPDISIKSTARNGSTVVDLTDPTSKFYKIIRDGCALNRVINTLNRFGYRQKFDPAPVMTGDNKLTIS